MKIKIKLKMNICANIHTYLLLIQKYKQEAQFYGKEEI